MVRMQQHISLWRPWWSCIPRLCMWLRGDWYTIPNQSTWTLNPTELIHDAREHCEKYRFSEPTLCPHAGIFKMSVECKIPRTQANYQHCKFSKQNILHTAFSERAPFTLTLSKIQRETLMFREQTCITKHWGSFVWNSMHLYQRVYAFSNYPGHPEFRANPELEATE